MTIWKAITAFGDSAILLPMIAWMAVCLLIPPARRGDALRWMLAAGLCGGVVMLSKLLFMAWGIRPPGLDYTGFSGHTALAVLVWPALAGLLLRGRPRGLRMAGVLLGAALALAVGLSRLALRYHTLSEVCLGAGLGTAIAFWFLRSLFAPGAAEGYASPRRGTILCCGALAILLLCYGRVFPSQHLLRDIAVWLSGHGDVFTRQGSG